MAGAAFDDIDRSVRNQAQQLGGFGAHILRPGMAGHVDCNAFVHGFQTGRQAMPLRNVEHIFINVEHRFRQSFHIRIVRHNQRPFEFQHQPAGGGERHDLEPRIDQAAQFARNLRRLVGDFLHLRLFEKRHAAASRIGGAGFDANVIEYCARGHGARRIVVIDEAGGKQRRLALSECRRRRIGRSRHFAVLHHKCFRREFRQ